MMTSLYHLYAEMKTDGMKKNETRLTFPASKKSVYKYELINITIKSNNF